MSSRQAKRVKSEHTGDELSLDIAHACFIQNYCVAHFIKIKCLQRRTRQTKIKVSILSFTIWMDIFEKIIIFEVEFSTKKVRFNTHMRLLERIACIQYIFQLQSRLTQKILYACVVSFT